MTAIATATWALMSRHGTRPDPTAEGTGSLIDAGGHYSDSDTSLGADDLKVFRGFFGLLLSLNLRPLSSPWSEEGLLHCEVRVAQT